MGLFRRKDEHVAEHARARRQIEETRAQTVDMAARLVRLEAEVGIYKPLFTNQKGST